MAEELEVEAVVQELEPVLRLVVAEELEVEAVHGAEAGASPAAGGGRGAGGRGSGAEAGANPAAGGGRGAGGPRQWCRSWSQSCGW